MGSKSTNSSEKQRVRWGLGLLGIACSFGLVWAGVVWLLPHRDRAWVTASSEKTEKSAAIPTDPKQLAKLGGTLFTDAPQEIARAPRLRAVAIPNSPGVMAIWGASGRDSRGHIWVGTSSVDWLMPQTAPGEPEPMRSAHLLEYDPAGLTLRDRGDSIEQLRLAGLLAQGHSQQKIHTKIVEGQDGYLYFATSDETGAIMDGSKRPIWPSHLWRIEPGAIGSKWEHLMTAPDALIALGCGGRYVYMLGWFGHVLYCYDTVSEKWQSTRVGSDLGHISRNFIVDARGHAYVPRFRLGTTKGEEYLNVSLVEFSGDLREVASNKLPLEHYFHKDENHGITGVQPMADGSIVFVTHPGYLFRIHPHESGPATLKELGRVHPKQEAAVESLFTYDGKRYLASVVQEKKENSSRWQWIVHDLIENKATVDDFDGEIAPLRLEYQSKTIPDWNSLQKLKMDDASISIYGCATRDDKGAFYFVGRKAYTPILIRAQLPNDNRNEPIPPQILDLIANNRIPDAPPNQGSGRLAESTKPNVAPPERNGPLFDPLAPSGVAPGENDPWLARAEFVRQLKAILKTEGDRSAPAINELCEKTGRGVTPQMKSSVGRIAELSRKTIVSLDARVQMLRITGMPEGAVLDELFKAESALIGSRNGPRNKADAMVRAARKLVALPVTPPTLPKAP